MEEELLEMKFDAQKNPLGAEKKELVFYLALCFSL